MRPKSRMQVKWDKLRQTGAGREAHDESLTEAELCIRDILGKDSAVLNGITDVDPVAAAKQVHIFWWL